MSVTSRPSAEPILPLAFRFSSSAIILFSLPPPSGVPAMISPSAAMSTMPPMMVSMIRLLRFLIWTLLPLAVTRSRSTSKGTACLPISPSRLRKTALSAVMTAPLLPAAPWISPHESICTAPLTVTGARFKSAPLSRYRPFSSAPSPAAAVRTPLTFTPRALSAAPMVPPLLRSRFKSPSVLIPEW